MIRKIELINFMSHAHTVIEPAAGLTVLVGPNNCGKSAVFTGIQCAVRRTTGSFMVRHEEKACSVMLTMGDGTIVGFRRRGGPSFVLNGEEGLGFTKENAEKLASAAKLPEVKFQDDDKSAEVHFALQKSPVFLLDSTPSTIAKFFGASSDAGKLIRMRTVLRRREQADGALRARLEEACARRELELAALAPVDEVGEAITRAEVVRGEIGAAEMRCAELARVVGVIERVGEECGVLRARVDALRALAEPPRLEDERALSGLIDAAEREANGAARLERVGRALAALSVPPEMGPVTELGACIARVEGEGAACVKLGTMLELLRELPAPPEMASDVGIVEAGKVLRAASDEAAKCAAAVKDAAAAFAACDAELERARELLGVCPTCGASMVGGHEHRGGAA